jgi:ArsR family transcriptional regulator
MAQVLKVLAHADRLRMIDIIEASRCVPVHAIVEALGLPQAATSQHLNQMRRIGLIGAERRGREVWYSIADSSALTILTCMRTKQGGK